MLTLIRAGASVRIIPPKPRPWYTFARWSGAASCNVAVAGWRAGTETSVAVAGVVSPGAPLARPPT